MIAVLIALAAGGFSWIGLALWEKRSDKHKVQTPNNSKGKSALIDYGVYILSLREKLLCIVIISGILGVIGAIFYKNIAVSALFSLFGLLYPRVRKRELREKRKNKLNLQFKQALYCLSSSIAAGRSVESAFKETLLDLKLLFPDPFCHIVTEFEIIQRRLDNGEPIEQAILDFSRRAHLEDVANFADVFVTCKRTGGNLVEVIRRTTGIIGEKLEIEQDISVMIAQKKFESKVLLFAPIVVVALLSSSSPEYMEPLYRGVGYLIMTVSLAMLAFCYWLTKIIMEIKV